MLLALAITLLAGCSRWAGSGRIAARSLRAEPVLVDGRVMTAIYTDLKPETSFFISDVSLDELLRGEIRRGLVAHVDLLWIPKAGATPTDSTATNVSIHLIVVADGELGVYGGAGFASPRNEVGDRRFEIVLEDASLTLLDATPGFVDWLSPARLTGRFRATLDRQHAQQVQRAISQFVTNALGRSRYVELSGSDYLAAIEPILTRR